MAAIPCPDFITDPAPLVPKRIVCTNRTCLADRFVNFVASLDLSPDQKDEAGTGVLAWSLWDIPASFAAQIDDDRGEDLIALSIKDNLFWLDWDRYQDEWTWNGFAPINRMVRFGPIPSNENETSKGGYDLSSLKRFREFQWELESGNTGAPQPFWTIKVAEWRNEDTTERSGVRRTTSRMRARIATKGKAFVVTLEHSANEPCSSVAWHAEWDDLGKRIRESTVVE